MVQIDRLEMTWVAKSGIQILRKNLTSLMAQLDLNTDILTASVRTSSKTSQRILNLYTESL